MDVIKTIKLLIPITVYGVIVVVFLNRLNELNNNLLEEYSDSFFMDLLGHNDWQPLKYFGIALVLGAIAILGVVFCWNIIKRNYVDGEELLVSVLSMIACVFFVILILKYISVPILKAVFLATVALVGGTYSLSKK